MTIVNDKKTVNVNSDMRLQNKYLLLLIYAEQSFVNFGLGLINIIL